MTTYLYSDAYLAPLVTQDRESRAIADIAAYGTFPADWTERLVRLRAYVIVCLESAKAPDDLFTAKLSAYRKEFDQALPLARAAQDAVNAAAGTTTSSSLISIPLERA